jgi:2-aminophenol/2-amino-5-chlorophenol 1,6-dioxygenase beta subunit
VDVNLAISISNEARQLGLTSKPMTNPDFRVDYGTITSLHMMNPDWDIPIIALSSNNSPYFHDPKVAQEEMVKLGAATRNAIIKSGKKVVLAASNSLSHLHFSAEPNPDLPEDMSQEHVFSQAQYEWDVRVLNLMRTGDTEGLLAALPDFISEAHAEIKAGALVWMLSAMEFTNLPAKVHAYGNVIGTGNAVVEWDLESQQMGIAP